MGGSLETHAVRALLSNGSRFDVESIEGIADDAYWRAALPIAFPNPLLIAYRHEIATAPADLAVTHGATDGETILYRPGGRRAQGIVILHELAHVLLRRTNAPHDERDAWMLTLALSAPLQSLRPRPRFVDLVRRQHHAPSWALRLRLSMTSQAQSEAA